MRNGAEQMARANSGLRGFTIIEMMVVIGIVALLAALLVPAISSVKESAGETKCASNLHQIGAATMNYLAIHKEHLPQMKAEIDPGPPAVEAVIGALFGGKRGTLPAYGIDQFGADKRPLNKYMGNTNGLTADSEMRVFECPLDRGQPPHPFLPQSASMYELIGTSYNLNDHSLDGEYCATLVPRQTGTRPGGRMPAVADPAKTWMVADVSVYNYQDDNQNGVGDDDRLQRWHYKSARCNMCFVDGHVSAVDLEKGLINTSRIYTFLPGPGWLCGPGDPAEE